jgi:hypothetical protein
VVEKEEVMTRRLCSIVALLVCVGCGPAFVHGPVGPAAATAPVQALADTWRQQLDKTSPYGGCWIAFVFADGLTEGRCPYPFVPEGVQIFRRCVDPAWPYGLNLGDGLIVACGRRRD